MNKIMSEKKNSVVIFALIVLLSITSSGVYGDQVEEDWGGYLVKREDRRPVVSTEYGEISAVRVTDIINGSYLVHFFTLEPNALFLPVVLHADMIFYVHTGSGRLSWTEENELKRTDLRRGDVYRLEQGSVFFIQSNLETESERQKLRIHALFVSNSNQDSYELPTGPYSSIRDVILGFDRKVLQAAFTVSEDVIEELVSGARQPAIIHAIPETKKTIWELESRFIRSIVGSRSRNIFELNKKKKKGSAKLYNLFKEDKDFENCNGWSTAVTQKKLSALRGSNIGLFMVNLTIGSMMGPHWNPTATEIAVVLQGQGMVRVVCSEVSDRTSCRNMRFNVKEGDVFAVPRFHPMAQMAFNNDTFVFMGFSTSANKNHPQYLAGQASVLRALDKDVLAMSFGVPNTTVDQLFAQQRESVILGCTSCAEAEFGIMQEEIEKERKEARKREEEAARKREEEERKREEEAARKEEEERRKKEEEEEEARREEEERREREEEQEAARKKEEEEAARREEEERKREEEAAREAEEKQRQEQQEAERKREEEAAREAEKRQREEEQKEEAEERQRQQEEKEAARREEEERRRRQEEEEEAARKEEEERQRQQQEEEAARREEDEREREEEAARREAEERGREEEEREGGASEEERAAKEERRREEEARREEGEEAAEEQGGGGGTEEGEAGEEARLAHEKHGSDQAWKRIILRKRLTVS